MTAAMNLPPVIITIDGPAGAGKSTVARQLASRLGLDFLDSGAMYRGVAAAVVDAKIDPANTRVVAGMTNALQITFDWQEDPPELLINGHSVMSRLRDPDVTAAVSEIAANISVRSVLVNAQRQIGREHPRLVTEGRDQGSVVFPRAHVKFYLDASPKVRAIRRAQQLDAMGQEVDVEAIHAQIEKRDQRDTTRKDGPLLCPNDAQRIDTSDMTLPQVVHLLEERSREALPGGFQ